MGKRALLAATALLLWPVSQISMAQDSKAVASPKPDTSTVTPSESPNKVVSYTAWDDDYFYVAVQVNKPTILAKNAEPFSRPMDDDSVVVLLQMDNDHAVTKRNAKTFSLAVSAANGFQFYSGADSTPLFLSLDDFNTRLTEIAKTETDPAAQSRKLLELQGRVVKVKVVQVGGLRSGGGNLPGYTVEAAIPWTDLGGKLPAGARLGYDIAVQSKAAGSPAMQSLAPGVISLADADNPSLWTQVVLSNSPGQSSARNIVSPRVFNQKPVIDGEISASEWNGLSLVAFGEAPGTTSISVSLASILKSRSPLEFALRQPKPVVAPPTLSADPLPVADHKRQSVSPFVMARWEYWFQSDSRKAVPALHVSRADQSSALAHHPLEGTGPWFSFDNVDWQRRQLLDMRQAGVDVVLPVYRGGARDRQLYSDKGLSVLASALQAMRQSGQDYPQVALFLDTEAVLQTFGDRPDLRDLPVKSALYEMIRGFYRRIPAEFRCAYTLSAENGGHRAYPVYLSDASPFKDFDGSFAAYIRGRFLRDFGADLVLIGGESFRAKAPLDGYFATNRDGSLQFSDGGWLKLAALGAGYDNALLDDGNGKAGGRSEDRYRASWASAVQRKPDIVLLDGWNDYAHGAEIAPSIEDGYTGVDVTRVYTRSLSGANRFGVKYLGHDVPEVVVSGETLAVTLRIQNSGLMEWSSQGGVPVAFHAVWRHGDTVAAQSEGVSITDGVLPGQDLSLQLSVPVGKRGGAGLAPGEYSLLLVPVVAGEGKNPKDDPLSRSLEVPVKVLGKGTAMPDWAATVVRSDVPALMEGGNGYLVDAVLRNDGGLPWSKGDRITLRLYRTASGDTAQDPPAADEVVSAADASTVLDQSVAPGQTVPVHLLLPLADTAGKAVPAWNQEDLWTYLTRWEFARGDQPEVRTAAASTVASTGVSFAPAPIVVTDFDFGVRFTADHTPASLPADRKQPVTLSLLNTGPQTWKRAEVRVGYHWYYLDGTELRWEDELTAIPQDVPPGGRVTDLLVNVTAPPTDGSYFLVWDVKFGDMWASTSAVSRTSATVVHPIQVVGNRLVFADLTKSFNVNGISDGDRSAGDFDGKGDAFISAWMPPYTDAPVTPSAMWLPADATGPESARRISFRWGPKTPKANNFVSCRGQKLDLGKSSGECKVLHLVAASTDADVTVPLKLVFQEPTSQSEDQYSITVSRWDHPASHGEELALLARRHAERDGMKQGAVGLFHYVIKIREPRKLVSIELPNLPQVKIAAITLEK